MPTIFVPKKETPEKIFPPSTQASSTPTNPLGLFSAYCINPTGISFANQEPQEDIVLFLRRHFITNFPWIISVIVLLIALPLIIWVSNFFSISFFPIPPTLSLVLIAFYYLFVLNYAFLRFINWFYHVGIVTRKRLLDLDIDNILTYHLAETEIADVVDVSYSQRGFFQSFFNYGDVPIQTEALKANFEFEHTPNPSTVADIVTDLRPKNKGGEPHV